MADVLGVAGAPIEALSNLLFLILRHNAAVLVLCLLIIVGSWWFHRRAVRDLRKLHGGLGRRLAVLQPVFAAPGTETAQRLFAENYVEINAAMSDDPDSALAAAWEQFRESLVDESQQTIRATGRAEIWFLELADATRKLAWGANIAVAVGLVFTFLGLIAAITSAQATLGANDQGGSTTQALQTLLAITGTKFWTSVAGLGCSIGLRRSERHWHDRLQDRLMRLARLLDRGTLYTPIQRIADAQLRMLGEQTDVLKLLATDMATAVDNAMNQRMEPMVAVLERIDAQLRGFQEGALARISTDISAAIVKHSGLQIEGFGNSLGTAADRFTQVSSQLTALPDRFANALAEVEARLIAEQEQACARIREVADVMVTEILAVAEQAAPLVGAMGDVADATGGQARAMVRMTDRTVESARNIEKAIAELATAVEPLADAARTAATAALTLNNAVAGQVEAAERIAGMLAQSTVAGSQALSSHEMRFAAADEALGNVLKRLVDATAEHAKAVNEQMQTLDHAMARAVNDFGEAVEPMASLTEHIAKLAAQTKKG